MTTAAEPTWRTRQKAERRRDLLRAAARLFAERGFHGVSTADLSSAVGLSGPALYRHFASKEAVLADVLVSVSHRLLDGGSAEVAAADDPHEALRRLVGFQADFALTEPELIRVQDRDLSSLSDSEAAKVRRLQRAYVDVWVQALLRTRPDLSAPVARTMAQAAFGLLNSTPHSARGRDLATTRTVLVQMALAGLLAADAEPPGAA